jgi:ribosomal protein S18 acetylase RimI-like enzyme
LRRPAAQLRLGGFTARLADDSQLAAVEACVRGAFDYFRRVEGPRPPPLIAAEHLFETQADPSRRLYLLSGRTGGPPLGMLELALGTPEPHDCTLVLLVLAESLRHRGLGREIASALFDKLAACGYRCVRLGVARWDRRAAEFWSSLGMWECGRQEGFRLFELRLGALQRSSHG